MKYLEGEEIIVEEFKAVIRKVIINMQMILVFCGLLYRNKGVQLFLDVVVDYLLLLVDIAVVKGFLFDIGEEIERKISEDELFCVLVFKIMFDLYVGKLIFLRVYFGVFYVGFYVYNLIKNKKERVGRFLYMYVNYREDVDVVYVGDICAVIGFFNIIIGDIFCDENYLIVLEFMEFLEFVIQVVIELKIKVDQEKMGIVLQRFVEEDLIFKVFINYEIGQIFIVGMGEFYFEIIVDRMRREFKVEVNVGKFQVVYKEIIKKFVKVEGKYIRQFGGRGQYGYVWFEFELFERGVGYEFVNKIVGGVILKEFILFVDVGVQEVMQLGVLVGYFVVDVRVMLFDGLYYEVDLSDMVFRIAAV